VEGTQRKKAVKGGSRKLSQQELERKPRNSACSKFNYSVAGGPTDSHPEKKNRKKKKKAREINSQGT